MKTSMNNYYIWNNPKNKRFAPYRIKTVGRFLVLLSAAYFLPSCSVGSLDSLRDLGYNQVTMIIRRYPFMLPGEERRWESDVS